MELHLICILNVRTCKIASIFGVLILTAEFRCEFILKYFRFLDGNMGKGFFLIL